LFPKFNLISFFTFGTLIATSMRGLLTITFLIISNTFMTFAWYGHLKFKEMEWGKNLGLFSVILISWGMAFFEYLFQVPANRYGFKENGGPFSLVELKTIQEAITLVIFMLFSMIVFKQRFEWNHILGFCLLIAAVFVIFKKW
jgi:uncharacterized protein (DUF486 family)